MGLGVLGHIDFNWDFLIGFLSIVFIDLILAGDNAVVIALAVKGLPGQQRKIGIILGAGIAVILRVLITLFATRLLMIKFVKLIGGALIIWIAVKLFSEAVTFEEMEKQPKVLWRAIWVITVADITMSLDNILAVAGASRGNPFLLLFGLGLSIPFVVFTSSLLSRWMDKYPFIIYLGAAILGRVGAEMMMTDLFVIQTLHPSKILQYGIEALFTLVVIVAGKLLMKIRSSRMKEGADETLPIDDLKSKRSN